ncbi:MAG: flagellar FlbD family protein [Mahellales bacterium]
MVKVTRLNGKKMVINCELIESVEATPDTVVTLSNGKKIVVKEDIDTLVQLVVQYKGKILDFCRRIKG